MAVVFCITSTRSLGKTLKKEKSEDEAFELSKDRDNCKEMEENNKPMADWALVALVVDRACCVIFSIIVLAMFIVLIIIVILN